MIDIGPSTHKQLPPAQNITGSPLTSHAPKSSGPSKNMISMIFSLTLGAYSLSRNRGLFSHQPKFTYSSPCPLFSSKSFHCWWPHLCELSVYVLKYGQNWTFRLQSSQSLLRGRQKSTILEIDGLTQIGGIYNPEELIDTEKRKR